VFSFITTLALSISAYATCTNDVDLGSHKITTSATNFSSNEFVTKAYVDKTIYEGNTTITAPSGYGIILEVEEHG
jgi:hypothetical protein